MADATSEIETDTLVKFALDVYRSDGVGPACLHLQDSYAVDVNVVLFACHVGAVRSEVLTQANLDAAHQRIDAWHREVVKPLRSVRKRLKAGPYPAPSEATAAVRRKIQQVEIEAELVELAELGASGWPSPAPTATGSADARAAAAIRVVVAGYSEGPLTPTDDKAIATIASAALRRASGIRGR